MTESLMLDYVLISLGLGLVSASSFYYFDTFSMTSYRHAEIDRFQ